MEPRYAKQHTPGTLSKIITESGFLSFTGETFRLETLNHVNAVFAEIKTLSRKRPTHLQRFSRTPPGTRRISGTDWRSNVCSTNPNRSYSHRTWRKRTWIWNRFLSPILRKALGVTEKRNTLALPRYCFSLENRSLRMKKNVVCFCCRHSCRNSNFFTAPHAFRKWKRTIGKSISRWNWFPFSTRRKPKPYEEQVIERLKSDLSFLLTKKIEEEAFLKELLSPDRFALSPTAFENYRECPSKISSGKCHSYSRYQNAHLSLEQPFILLWNLFTEYRKQKKLPQQRNCLFALRKALEREIVMETEQEGLFRKDTKIWTLILINLEEISTASRNRTRLSSPSCCAQWNGIHYRKNW